ncbi:TrkA C-terminal domain-containing protein [Pelosinus sp. IPA-1]|uniref:TrkA C-terminal domain-containing protein n=1 Tax=Pelosinus sp. IPA-1 TaxID=3029569 RepID=UPI0024362834|nr:TrkA C-terminal domain-containing protein [Pelosinus sp. IPA-1]GMA99939.1 GntR family transcriptional regulator [Pelosinus sp. IPA-1]
MPSAFPMYHSIALDIAQRIVNNEFPVGSRISGRTLLASHYNVSSETIRKAIALLKDANIVSVSQGKEVVVLSIEGAYPFITHHKSMQSVYSLKQELEALLTQKLVIDKRLQEIFSEIVGYSDRLKNLNPYNPIEIKVPFDSHLVGRSVADIKFWQSTGATIVAIRRDRKIDISPGPNAIIEPDDRLIIVGKSNILQKATQFVEKNKKIT